MPNGPTNWQPLVPIGVMMVVMIALFWWTVVRPASSRQKRHQKLIDDLRVGDKVITAGGIYGTLRRVGNDSVDLDAGEVTLKVDRRAIRRKQSGKDI
jgi:preprotein translocase subunit YajC